MEKKYLVLVLAVVGIFLLSNSNIQGNVVRVTQVSADTNPNYITSPQGFGQQSLTAAPPVGPIATPQPIICQMIGSDEAFITANPGTNLPFNAGTILNSINMPNALKSTNVAGSTLTQTINTDGNFIFGINNAPIDFVSIFFHLDDGQKLANYYFTFSPPIIPAVGQAWYLLGRYYTVTYAGPTPGLPSFYRINLQGCQDQYGNTPFIQMDGSVNQLLVKINYEVIEDVGGHMIFVGNQLQEIKWTITVDAPPSYNNLDMPDGDYELKYMLDEPQGLLGLNAALDVTPINSATCGTQYSVDLAYILLYS